MTTTLTRPLDLFEATERAYRTARRTVFDTLAPGQLLDMGALSDYQRKVLHELSLAEERVAAYRCATRAARAARAA